ncbi:MAG TPA: anti-sigma factor [Streptosporangiaceae bacterium]|nr:anti-sigma factor [Streptosporangiaceae bacterium]
MSEDSADVRVHAEVAGWVLGSLGPRQSAEYPGHLRECAGCADELERLEPVRRLLDTAAPEAELPASLQTRTLDAVRRAAAARQRRRRTTWLTSAAAACVILLAVIAVAVFRPQPGVSVRFALAAVPQSDGGLGGSATGQVTAHETTNGWSIQLSVRGLKTLDEHGFYECWYATGLDDPPQHLDRISAGTFEVKPDGSALVSMWSWADPRKFKIMKITQENATGQPAQTARAPVALEGHLRA